MKVLFIGFVGFIGFYVVNCLLDCGDMVIGFDNFNEYYDFEFKCCCNEMLIEWDGFYFVCGDFNDFDVFGEVYDKVGFGDDMCVCYFVVQVGVWYLIENLSEFVKDNIFGFQNIFDFIKDCGVGGFIYVLSFLVYGDNKDEVFFEVLDMDVQVLFYGMIKKVNELQVEVYNCFFGLYVMGFCFFIVYGFWGCLDMVFFFFIDVILWGNLMKVFGFGKMCCDFIYVDDIVDGIVGFFDMNFLKVVFNFGVDKIEEFMDFIDQIEKLCGVEGEKEFLLMQFGDVIQMCVDVDRVCEMIGYELKVKIDVGVLKFVEWYCEYYGI